LVKLVKQEAVMPAAKKHVSLYDAKTHLSALVEEAASGQEVVITKNGKPRAKLVALPEEKTGKRVFGQNYMGITYVADDFDAPSPEIERMFGLRD
jgi:prevent-host-death family protein